MSQKNNHRDDKIVEGSSRQAASEAKNEYNNEKSTAEGQSSNKPKNTWSLLHTIDQNSLETLEICSRSVAKNTIIDELGSSQSKELNLRSSTITFQKSSSLTHQNIIDYIDEGWVTHGNNLPLVYWQNCDHTYCQFNNQNNRDKFVMLLFPELNLDGQDSVTAAPAQVAVSSKININDISRRDELINQLRKHLVIVTNTNIDTSKNMQLLHNFIAQAKTLNRSIDINKLVFFQRKPVKIELEYMRPEINHKIIDDSLKKVCKPGSLISPIKVGKEHGKKKTRSFIFQVNGEAFKILFRDLQGSLAYMDTDKQIHSRFRFRIDCRPWVCKSCYSFGRHVCTGKRCSNCSSSGHSSFNCKSSRSFCYHCKRSGHGPKHLLRCSTYMIELVKQIRKVDIPIQYYQDINARKTLVKCLKYK